MATVAAPKTIIKSTDRPEVKKVKELLMRTRAYNEACNAYFYEEMWKLDVLEILGFYHDSRAEGMQEISKLIK